MLLAISASLFPRPVQKLISKAIFNLPTSFTDISFDYKLKKFMEGMPFPIEQANTLWKGAFRPEEKNSILTLHLLVAPDRSVLEKNQHFLKKIKKKLTSDKKHFTFCKM